MMFLHKPGDMKSYILYGKPTGKKEKAEGLIKMPGFKGRITSAELSDLTVYLKAVMETIDINDEMASAGFDKMKNLGCFGCHGIMAWAGCPIQDHLKVTSPAGMAMISKTWCMMRMNSTSGSKRAR